MAGKRAVLIIARRDFLGEECANPRTALVVALIIWGFVTSILTGS